MSDPLQASILIVDDEAAHLKALCDTLSIEGYTTTGTSGDARRVRNRAAYKSTSC
jgi:CheY-like chemotaxis protein